jgi:transposase InsO family protein
MEAMAQEEGFKIHNYHSDNRIFAAPEFKDHCNCHQMKHSFSGVGAKHQNGIAERNIKTVTQWAHANMLYLATSWLNEQIQNTGHKRLIMQHGSSINSQTWNPEFLQMNYGLVYVEMTASCNVPMSLVAQSMSLI